MNSEPQCLWTTGVITNNFTALPETEHMKAEDISLNCAGKKLTKSILTVRPHKLEQALMQDGPC
eukprot:14518944-Heterocapsa_arctica.AAC.1